MEKAYKWERCSTSKNSRQSFDHRPSGDGTYALIPSIDVTVASSNSVKDCNTCTKHSHRAPVDNAY